VHGSGALPTAVACGAPEDEGLGGADPLTRHHSLLHLHSAWQRSAKKRTESLSCCETEIVEKWTAR